MRRRRLPAVLVPVVLAAAVGCFRAPPPTGESAAAPTDPDAVPPQRVRLAVVVVFDQMRADYLERWQPLFRPDGFNRLLHDGAWFANCHYPYATTTTGPGHASILSGCSPDRHGIINNEWFDRATGETVYCAGSTRYGVVPSSQTGKDEAETALDAAKKKPKAAGTPDRLLAPTVADVLKEATGKKGKVVGVSLKDRGAILPTGHGPDGAYWFNDRLVTSTYYRDALPRWAADLNRSGFADKWYGKPWTRLRPDLDYDRLAGPDAGLGEPVKTATFPHPLGSGTKTPTSSYYGALATSPFGNDVVLAAAKAAVVGESLGADDTPDLLLVSFSSNDLVGHTWGPDSQEVLDVTLRSDAVVADLLGFLDAKVGPGNYSLVLTADHGVCPTPEVSAARGIDARRVPLPAFTAAADKFLQEKYGTAPGKPADPKSTKPVWIESMALPHVYLNHKLLKAKKLNPAAAAAELAGWLRDRPEVARAFTRTELTAEPSASTDGIEAAVRKAYYPPRGGDVYVVGRPFYLWGSGAGTSHGTPYEYDTHVPLLAYGPGVGGGRREEPTVPQQAATITAEFLGLPLPRMCEYEVPETLGDD